MSTEAWISLAGILVSMFLAVTTGVVMVVGWLLSRLITGLSDRVDCLESDTGENGNRLTAIETILKERGYIVPPTIAYQNRNSGGTTQ